MLTASDLITIRDRIKNQLETAEIVAKDFGITPGYALAIANDRIDAKLKTRTSPSQAQIEIAERQRLLSWPVPGAA